MKVEITYIIHSCFTVEFDDRVLLFDYPGRSFSTKRTKKLVESKLNDKTALILSSHSHGDHFTQDVFQFQKAASQTIFVLSDDIAISRNSIPSNFKMIGPEEEITIEGISIETFESNDAGVAFFLTYRDKKIYYGGDLAKWDWPEWSSLKQKQHVKVFEDVLDILKDRGVDVAFSNMDERLESWAGPLDFIRTLTPRYFVPMHTFGNEEWIEDLMDEDIPSKTNIFNYKEIGDSVEWNI